MPDFSTTEETSYPKQIVLDTHPPVISAMAFSVVAVTLVAGVVLSYDVDVTDPANPITKETLVAYDGTYPAVAVLTEEIDTSTVTLGKVCVHGIVDKRLLSHHDDATLMSLRANNIYT